MNSFLLAAIAIVAAAAPAAAARIPAVATNPMPVKNVQQRVPTRIAQLQAPAGASQWAAPSSFTTRVHLPAGLAADASAAACDRRAVGITFNGGTTSVNGASDSRTLIAVPVAGGSISSATTQQQITDVCDHN